MLPRRQVINCVCVVTAMFTGGLAHAQQTRGIFSGSPGTFRIATNPAVAEELKLTNEQRAVVIKLKATSAKLAREYIETRSRRERQAIQASIKEFEEQPAKITAADQRARWRQERQERLATIKKFDEQQARLEEQLAKSLGKENYQRVHQLDLQIGGVVNVFLVVRAHFSTGVFLDGEVVYMLMDEGAA